MRKDFEKKGLISAAEFEAYLLYNAPDPLLLAITRLCAERNRTQPTDHPQDTDPQTIPTQEFEPVEAT